MRPRLTALSLVALLSGVASTGPAFAGPGSRPQVTTSVQPTTARATAERYKACLRATAARSTTNLRPVRAITAANSRDRAVGTIPHGVVRVEHAANLILSDGRIGAGNGYDAMTGLVGPVRVSHLPVIAPVTLVVLDSKQAGRRVAFVEVRIKPAKPVRWQVSNTLSIITDGGDGGFSRGTAAVDESLSDSVVEDYVAAYGTDNSGTVCILRLATKGAAIDGVAFFTGYGDGYYPTFVGKDKTGAVVSIVSYGGVLPWRDAGLPGKAPTYDFSG